MPIYALGDHVPDIHPEAYVHPEATVIGRVTLDASATVWPGAVLRGDYGAITIGARTSIQDGTVVHTTAPWPTVIGAECVIGHNTHLEGCVVEDRCLIGSGSVVLNRVRIGTESVIGAGAVVTEDSVIPARHTALGVPARVRAGGVDPLWHDEAVQLYVANGQQYAAGLRQVASQWPTPCPPPPAWGDPGVEPERRGGRLPGMTGHGRTNGGANGRSNRRATG
ncbi:gamma carbonic anhydrase family protein [Actinomadura sp. HBU206391]|uniref:gamma carbonic anhydrase family protein n=1 Tax=Actinomadura sp. HBU206391 TaxID=2731692 RepID=UPI001650963C|nr:gamma carbonic anhydrase family protein [Actinomadura sp. HBU206391]MBC6460999.1 gamma carbonic anhydrase family protein [Actinomadura sp. HBU206391]